MRLRFIAPSSLAYAAIFGWSIMTVAQGPGNLSSAPSPDCATAR
jgi:hypothetical protein